MKKRRFIIALSLSIILVMALALSGCGGNSDETSDGGGNDADFKSYNFGVNTWGSGVPILDLFGDEVEYAVKEVFGMTDTRASDDFTADKELQNVQNFAASGVDGMILQAAAVSTVPQMAQVCADAKIPFVFHVFIGDDADLEALATNNDYFLGAIDADMVRDGQEMGKAAYENGARTAVIIGGNVGDNNMDQRADGFRESFEAAGGKVLDEARCTDNSECLQKATAMLNAHKDADVLYAMVGDYIPGSLQAIKDLKLDTKVYMSCVDEASANLIKAGDIVMGNDGICLPSSLSTTLMLNYLDGHQILDENGNPPRLRTIPFKVTAENADDYLSVFATSGVHPITADVLKSLCYRYNDAVTYQDYVNLIESGLTLDAILEAHGN
jgi:ABC-type sugar transport system substrate-binding protein